MNASDAKLWVEVERKELEAKAKMGVCVLHPLPQDRLQDCCFVYQKNIEGFVYKRKFRKFALAQKNSQVKSGYDPPYLAKCASYTQEHKRRKIQEVLMAARTKNCYRKGPPKNAQLKFATEVQQRKDSRSTHPSPLEAKCLECQSYRQWNVKMNGWIACKIGCKEEDIEVKCTTCLTNANLNRKLDQLMELHVPCN